MANNYFVHDTALVPGTKARAADVNNRFNAVEDGFDKLPAPTAGGFLDPVVVGEASSEDHAVTAGQVRDGELTYTVDTGTANTMVAALPQPPPAYTAGMTITVKVAETNTGATVLDLNGLGARPVKRISGEQLYAGDLVAGRVVGLRYDGTSFILLDGTYAVHNHDDLYPRTTTLSAHTGSTSNPHSVTKAQVGLGNVSNVDTTNASNITSGTLADERIASTIARDSELAAHTSRTDNPHAVTKVQVGLGNVANVDTTNASNITSGTLADARIPSTITRDGEMTAALALKADAAATTAEFTSRSRKNLLINGGFVVWQDGPGYFGASGYCADQWYFDIIDGTGGYILRNSFGRGQISVPGGPLYHVNFKVDRTSGVSLAQRIPNFVQFMGKKLTCTFWAKLSTSMVDAFLDVKLNANYGTGGTPSTPTSPIATGSTGSFVPTTTWTKYTSVFDVPVVAPTWGTDVGSDYLELQFTLLNMTGLDGLVNIANVQLEFGDTATDFEYRHPAEELMLCQRYYEKGTLRGPFTQYAVDFAVGPQVSFLVEKRKVPLVTLGALSAIGHGDGTPGALYNANATTRSINPVYNWTGGTVGRSFFGQVGWTADARL